MKTGKHQGHWFSKPFFSWEGLTQCHHRVDYAIKSHGWFAVSSVVGRRFVQNVIHYKLVFHDREAFLDGPFRHIPPALKFNEDGHMEITS